MIALGHDDHLVPWLACSDVWCFLLEHKSEKKFIARANKYFKTGTGRHWKRVIMNIFIAIKGSLGGELCAYKINTILTCLCGWPPIDFAQGLGRSAALRN